MNSKTLLQSKQFETPPQNTIEITKIQSAISLIADQILDLYFDQLDQEE